VEVGSQRRSRPICYPRWCADREPASSDAVACGARKPPCLSSQRVIALGLNRTSSEEVVDLHPQTVHTRTQAPEVLARAKSFGSPCTRYTSESSC